MSRVGKAPILLDKSLKVEIGSDKVRVEGPRGKLELALVPGIRVEREDGKLIVRRVGDSPRDRAMHGLMRQLVANMVQGVSKGFSKTLEINGVGYRAEGRGNLLHLSLGYSHPIIYQLPPGVTAKVERQVVITVEGADRQLVGKVAADLRALRPPDPYKAKGIKYADEQVRRKAGKAAVGAK